MLALRYIRGYSNALSNKTSTSIAFRTLRNANVSNLESPTKKDYNVRSLPCKLPIQQGGYIVIDLQAMIDQDQSVKRNTHIVNITSAWQDHVDVSYIDTSRYTMNTTGVKNDTDTADNDNDNCNVSREGQGHREDQQLIISSLSSASSISSITSTEKEKEKEKEEDGGNDNTATTATSPSIDITVPEAVNIIIKACDHSILHLHIANKIEGDINLICTKGSVAIDKVRGMNINLQCGSASIKSSKLIEGHHVLLHGASINTNKVNGNTVKMISDSTISIKSMYCNEFAHLISASQVHVGLINGPITVNTDTGNVTLANIDGWFNVQVRSGHINLQVNKFSRTTSKLALATVTNTNTHTITTGEQGRGCQAVTINGSIAASLDPEIRASVRAHSTSRAGRARVTVVSDSFKLFKNTSSSRSRSRIRNSSSDIDTNTVVEELQNGVASALVQVEAAEESSNSSYSSRYLAEGILTGRYANNMSTPSPALTFERGSSNSGKINLRGMEALAKISKSYNSSSDNNTTITDSDIDIDMDMERERGYDLELIAHGHIRLETLSWMEIIKRKHGFGNDEQGNRVNAPTTVGRTASATKTWAAPANSNSESPRGAWR